MGQEGKVHSLNQIMLPGWLFRYILSLKQSFMLKSPLNPRSSAELCDLERFFLSEIDIPEQKVTPIDLPFYNFVCYAADMMAYFSKSSLEITFNVFLVDEHLRRYSNPIELYRRFIGFINSWKKYGDTDEGRLLATFLQTGRNQRKNVKLFLRLRKILLKNISQKILQQINLSHEDAATIVHTLNMVSAQQRGLLTKKINDHFIAKNVKYLHSTILNAAVLCQIFIAEINDNRKVNEKFGTNLSNKITKILKNQLDFIEEFSEDTIQKKNQSFSAEESSNQFLTNKQIEEIEGLCGKENVGPVRSEPAEENKCLVSLQKCMKQLYILKEKDLQIDNRFKRLSKVRELQ